MKTYDRNRNAITTGSRVMVETNGATGVIKEICGEGKSEEQLRRSDCVSIEGVEGLFCPMDLVRLGFH
ncbi:putative selenium delivery protein YdfZ [Enterobacter hormaechei]|uniref:putative selenium delivery protein YdfZ n=1 Tax=Enterobacter hormaechei TaxID=158836 RepID=UPI00253FAFD7|nr:putative selenium delivery protein YdfZ [Enterobacter hormaechei]MDK3080036.1 putative selenium delivery protein YdfZ [Enterobacter hormaechei]